MVTVNSAERFDRNGRSKRRSYTLDTQTETTIAGMPASAGRATGRARVLRADEPALVRNGEILVCTALPRTWMPLLAMAGGLVTAAGGALSRAATVARESGLPAVAGLRDATLHITDGQLLTVDGSTGVVTLHA